MSAPLLCLCLFLTNPRLKNPMLTECGSEIAKTGDRLQGCASLFGMEGIGMLADSNRKWKDFARIYKN